MTGKVSLVIEGRKAMTQPFDSVKSLRAAMLFMSLEYLFWDVAFDVRIDLKTPSVKDEQMLTQDLYEEIRRKYSCGEVVDALEKYYKIGHRKMYEILRGTYWLNYFPTEKAGTDLIIERYNKQAA